MTITHITHRKKIYNDGECNRTTLVTSCKRESGVASSIVQRKKYSDTKNMITAPITCRKKIYIGRKNMVATPIAYRKKYYNHRGMNGMMSAPSCNRNNGVASSIVPGKKYIDKKNMTTTPITCRKKFCKGRE